MAVERESRLGWLDVRFASNQAGCLSPALAKLGASETNRRTSAPASADVRSPVKLGRTALTNVCFWEVPIEPWVTGYGSCLG